jgi:hypothetical protein
MSACLVALVILGILSIFSAKYRSWAREALDCVTRRLTLRPCRTGFNEKVKAKVTSKIMKKSQKAARFAHKHFEAISWAFTLVMFVSLAYTAYGVFNLVTIGTCDPANPDQCVFNPDLPHCENPVCVREDHCFCDGREIPCSDPIFISCEGDCACVCAGGDKLTSG